MPKALYIAAVVFAGTVATYLILTRKKTEAYLAAKVTEDDMDRNYNVDNHPAVQAWTNETFKTRKAFDRHMSLLKDNREALKKIFGPRNGTFKSEFNFSIWQVDFRGRSYHILSAAGKGTGYELVLKKSETFASVGKDKKLGEDMVAFLEDMIEKLRKPEVVLGAPKRYKTTIIAPEPGGVGTIAPPGEFFWDTVDNPDKKKEFGITGRVGGGGGPIVIYHKSQAHAEAFKKYIDDNGVQYISCTVNYPGLKHPTNCDWSS